MVIQIDSLRRDFLRCYGNDWVETPNLTALARESVVFDNHFVGSLPCMPARREIWAGTEELWWRPWGPLEPWDETIASLASRAGIRTGLVTDHYHFLEWGSHSYTYDFDGYEFVRGHESDNWRTAPAPVPDWATQLVERWSTPEHLRREVHQYLANVAHFESEADFFAPRVMSAAADWLRANADAKRFYLHVDSFDVHEPVHVPEPYRSLYTDGDYRRYSPWPHYGRTDEGRSALEVEELDWVRAQFAGKLTMVDRWLGRVLETLEETSLAETTVVVVTTDHGHFLGEHGWIGKPAAPLYDVLCRIPLLVRHPGVSARREPAITQTVDLHATVLELLGVVGERDENVHSKSFAPLLAGTGPGGRSVAVYGYSNERVGVATSDLRLLRDHDPRLAPAYTYSHHVEPWGPSGLRRRRSSRRIEVDLVAGDFVPGVRAPVWRRPYPGIAGSMADAPPRSDLLLTADGTVVEAAPGEARVQLEGLLREHLVALRVPDEQLVRLRLD